MARNIDVTEWWLTEIERVCVKVARCTSHIDYLSSCLSLGIVPKGLIVKLPMSAFPPPTRDSFYIFQFEISLQLTEFTLNTYINLRNSYCQERLIPLINVVKMATPEGGRRVQSIMDRTYPFLQNLLDENSRKLSSLCLQYLNSGIPLPFDFRKSYQHLINLIGMNNNLSRNPQAPLVPPLIHPPTSVAPPHSPASQFNVTADMELPTTFDDPTPPRTIANEPDSAFSEVCNLSSRVLSDVEKGVLSKGLSFSPNPKVDAIALHTDIQKFCRALRLRYYWKTQPAADSSMANQIETNPALLKFKPPSHFDPLVHRPLPPTHPLELFISRLEDETSTPQFLGSLRPQNKNLTVDEKRAIARLKSDHNLMIMPADKGSTVVLMDKNDYRSEVYRQLNDSEYYICLRSDDPSATFRREIEVYLRANGCREGLSRDDVQLLLPKEPRCPDFYILPKIHKNYSMPENPPPGRPIVASYGSLTERLSVFIDNHLQPLVHSQPSYCKDTFHFLEILNNVQIPSASSHPTLLVSVDVTSLYSNIPHTQGLLALREFLDRRPQPHSPSTGFLLQLSEFVLTKNYFTFEESVYLQIKGTAMGTPFAPSYANLYMANLEQNFLASQTHVPLLWTRFIDDIFLIWTHGEESLKTFLETLNTSYDVHFTWHISPTSVTFLDVTVTLGEEGISTEMYVKPTNPQQYLHFSSCHPRHVKRAIPRSLSIRSNRLCSRPGDRGKHSENLKNKLTQRGYPQNLVENRIVPSNVQYNPTPRQNSSSTPYLLTTYFPGVTRINSILRNLFPILSENSVTRDVFQSPPSMAYRRPPNLGNIFSHRRSNAADNTQPQPQGLQPCGNRRCQLCDVTLQSDTFSSPNNPEVFKCKGSTVCQSKNCVYKLTCQHDQCQAFYVGKSTTQLNERMNNHRSASRHHRNEPVANHTNLHSDEFNSCYKLQTLCQLPPDAPDGKFDALERPIFYSSWSTGTTETEPI